MDIFWVLLVLLLAARLFGTLAERFAQPALVGELIAGVLVQRYDQAFPVLAGLTESEAFRVVADLGIFFLMLLAGLELRPRDLLGTALVPSAVAVVGVVVPLAAGMALGWWWLPPSELKLAQSLFLGTAMAITAVPVAARVLLDVGQLRSAVGRTILTAAILDDVLGLVLLAVLTAVLQTGEAPSAAGLLWLCARAVLFFGATFGAGHLLFRRLGRTLMREGPPEREFGALILVALAFAALAEALHMHFMLGAFMAGLVFVRSGVGNEAYRTVERRVSGVAQGFLAPVFFVSVGMQLDASALLSSPAFVTVLIVLAFLVKLCTCVPALLGGLPTRQALAVGVGMSARGAVELVVADVALRAGLFRSPAGHPLVGDIHSAVVIMAIVTTLAPSIVLPRLLRPGPT
jgi:Kef-type K+ transport system membrane component KefB